MCLSQSVFQNRVIFTNRIVHCTPSLRHFRRHPWKRPDSFRFGIRIHQADKGRSRRCNKIGFCSKSGGSAQRVRPGSWFANFLIVGRSSAGHQGQMARTTRAAPCQSSRPDHRRQWGQDFSMVWSLVSASGQHLPQADWPDLGADLVFGLACAHEVPTSRRFSCGNRARRAAHHQFRLDDNLI